MACKLTEIAIDCADPVLLAHFWCATLGYRVLDAGDDGVITIGLAPVPADAEEAEGPIPPVLTFAPVPEAKSVKNRLHLDLNPTDRSQSDEVDRLIGFGARRVDIGQVEQSWVVLADPEGNEFCVLSSRRP